MDKEKQDISPNKLYEAIKHGDEEHRKWLKEAIESFFLGKQIPSPRGSGTKDALYREIEQLKKEIEELKNA